MAHVLETTRDAAHQSDAVDKAHALLKSLMPAETRDGACVHDDGVQKVEPGELAGWDAPRIKTIVWAGTRLSAVVERTERALVVA